MDGEFIDQNAELLRLIGERSLRIFLIVLVALFIWLLLRRLIRTLTRHIQRLDRIEDSEFDFRTRTILNFVNSLGVFVIIITAIMTILSELNINVAPLIASVGVAGLALGLGAQTLVKDAIAGLFILLEDQFHVGDAVTIAGVSGSVTALSLRTTQLRDLNGTLHIIPNGEIRLVANHTTEWSRARVEIMLPYSADVDTIFDIVRRVIAEVSQDEAVESELLEPMTVSGPESLDERGIMLRILAKVAAGQQWSIQRVLRRQLLVALKENGLELSNPRSEVLVITNQKQV